MKEKENISVETALKVVGQGIEIIILPDDNYNWNFKQMLDQAIATLHSQSDSIFIEWTVEDIMQRAREKDCLITKNDAINILKNIAHKHDCNYGVSWTLIDDFIEEYMKSN